MRLFLECKKRRTRRYRRELSGNAARREPAGPSQGNRARRVPWRADRSVPARLAGGASDVRRKIEKLGARTVGPAAHRQFSHSIPLMPFPVSTPSPLQAGESRTSINVEGIEISWNTGVGACTFRDIPVVLMWVDSTLAGLMSGVAAMVGPERFNLALQAEGRKSVESDWLLIGSYADFAEGFAQLNLNAKVAGWGDWRLFRYDAKKQECVFQVFNNWEGAYQKALGVCWGSGFLAGKLAGICSKLFRLDCWATQTRFVAKGDVCDEFVVSPSERSVEKEIENLLRTDQATRADMAVALKQLEDTQKILAESERRYAQLVRNIPDGIYMWYFQADGSMGFAYVSPRFCEILGLEAEAVLEDYRLAFAAAHPDDAPGLMRSNERARIAMMPFRWEGRFVIGGHTRWISISSDPLAQPDGGSVWNGVVRDITDLKRAQESQRLAALVYSNSREGMLVTDPENRILTINPAFTELTGYTEEDVLGRDPKVLSSGKHDREFYRAMWRMLDQTGHWQGEIWNRKKNGKVYPEWLRIDTIYAEDGKVGQRVALFTDITEKKHSEEIIWKQANFDFLTGLPNRAMFLSILEREIKRAAREEKKLALLFLDLDSFKDVNDTLGHQYGDELLKMTAERLLACVRETDTVARLGGDEFTAILTDLREPADINRVARCMTERVAQPFILKEQPAYVSASIGVTMYPDDALDAETLLKNADQAMYAAKGQGRSRYCFFTPSLQLAAEQRMRLILDLRAALEKKQFQVHYQPIVELATGRILKAEALIRWRHPERGYISPADFIPIAEETRLIQEIGNWVFRQAIAQIRLWQPWIGPEFQISVNKSPAQFLDSRHFHAGWIEQLGTLGLKGHNLVVEITEGLLLDAGQEVQDQLLQFRDAGIQVAIDDFGTGYSALSYLKKFDIDYLKIDRIFTRNLARGSTDLTLSKAIVSMAHELGLQVIAEGVETAEQRDLLKEIGCDYGQGYLFAKPLAAGEFEILLDARRLGGAPLPD